MKIVEIDEFIECFFVGRCETKYLSTTETVTKSENFWDLFCREFFVGKCEVNKFLIVKTAGNCER